jgi:hypothetical protein
MDSYRKPIENPLRSRPAKPGLTVFECRGGPKWPVLLLSTTTTVYACYQAGFLEIEVVEFFEMR